MSSFNNIESETVGGSLPQHVAIIMDGNNRWAAKRGLPGTSGHRAGAESARKILSACVNLNIPYLTLFAFSSENWFRPNKEVKGLMALFLAVLKRKEVAQFHNDNVRIQFIGNREGFSKKIQKHMNYVEKLTAKNTGTTVIIAADYGGQWDITNAVQEIVRQVEAGELSSKDVTCDLLQQHICSGQHPMPDLCIRTGGERRISNFLLWQFAYTELYFADCLWPDFGDEEFLLALEDFKTRQRRFGHLETPLKSANSA